MSFFLRRVAVFLRRVSIFLRRVALLEKRVAVLENRVALFAFDVKKPRIKWLSIWMIGVVGVRGELALVFVRPVRCVVVLFVIIWVFISWVLSIDFGLSL